MLPFVNKLIVRVLVTVLKQRKTSASALVRQQKANGTRSHRLNNCVWPVCNACLTCAARSPQIQQIQPVDLLNLSRLRQVPRPAGASTRLAFLSNGVGPSATWSFDAVGGFGWLALRSRPAAQLHTGTCEAGHGSIPALQHGRVR